MFAGAGGLTGGVAAVVGIIAEKLSKDELQKETEANFKELEEILNEANGLVREKRAQMPEEILQNIGLIAKIAKHFSWDLIISPAMDGATLAQITRTSAVVGGEVAVGALSVGALAVSIILLPVEIIFVGLAAKELVQENIPEICKYLNSLRDELEVPLREAAEKAGNLT